MNHKEFVALVERCRDQRGALAVVREAGAYWRRSPRAPSGGSKTHSRLVEAGEARSRSAPSSPGCRSHGRNEPLAGKGAAECPPPRHRRASSGRPATAHHRREDDDLTTNVLGAICLVGPPLRRTIRSAEAKRVNQRKPGHDATGATRPWGAGRCRVGIRAWSLGARSTTGRSRSPP
jgi:hypothetical protein